MKNELNVNYIWDAVSDFWQSFDDTESVSQLWRGYCKVVENLYYQMYQVELSKSIETIPYDWISDWEKVTCDSSTLVSYDAEASYPYTYSLPDGIRDVVMLAEGPREVTVLPNYTSVGADSDVLTLPSGENRLPGDKIYAPDDVISYEDRFFFPAGISVDAVKYYPGTDFIVDQDAKTISFKTQPYKNLWTNQSIRDLHTIYDNFGCLIGIYGTDSYSYLRQVQGLWYSFWNGASVDSMTKGITILTDLPFVETTGIVSDITINKHKATIGGHSFEVSQDCFNSLIQGARISAIDAAYHRVKYITTISVPADSELIAKLTKGTEIVNLASEDSVSFKIFSKITMSNVEAASFTADKDVAFTSWQEGKLCLGDGATAEDGEYYIKTPDVEIELEHSGLSFGEDYEDDRVFSIIHKIDGLYPQDGVSFSIGDIAPVDPCVPVYASDYTVVPTSWPYMALQKSYVIPLNAPVIDVDYENYTITISHVINGLRPETTEGMEAGVQVPDDSCIPWYAKDYTIASVHDPFISIYKDYVIPIALEDTPQARNHAKELMDKIMIGSYIKEVHKPDPINRDYKMSVTFANATTCLLPVELASQFQVGDVINDIEAHEDGLVDIEVVRSTVTVEDIPDDVRAQLKTGYRIHDLTEDSIVMRYETLVRLPEEAFDFIQVGDIVEKLEDASTIVNINGTDYTYLGNESVEIVRGQNVVKFDPMTNAVKVYDYINYPAWWDEYSGNEDDNRDTCELAGGMYLDGNIPNDTTGTLDSFASEECLDKYFLQHFTFTVKIDSSKWAGDEAQMGVLRAFLDAVKPAYTKYIFQYAFNISDDVFAVDSDIHFTWTENFTDYPLGVKEYDSATGKWLILPEYGAGLWYHDDEGEVHTCDDGLLDTTPQMDDDLQFVYYFTSDGEMGFDDIVPQGFIHDEESDITMDDSALTLDESSYADTLELEWRRTVELDRTKTIIRGETFKIETTLYEEGELVDYPVSDMYSDALFENGLRLTLNIEKDTTQPGKYILTSNVETWRLPGEQFQVNIGVYDNRGSVPMVVASFNDTFYIVDSATDLSNERVGHF